MIEEILHVPYYHPSEGWFFGKPITEDEAESLCRQMGIPFRRPDPKERAIAYLFSTPVAGTEYVECFDAIFDFLREGQRLTLSREPRNDYDHRAIAVYIDGRKAGYIPRRSNHLLSRIMDSGIKVFCTVSRDHPRDDRELYIDIFQEMPYPPAVRHVSFYPEIGGGMTSIDSVPVTRKSLGLVDMADYRSIPYNRRFSEDDMWNLSWGHRSGGFEDRWNLVLEDERILISRTWIEEIVYTIEMGPEGAYEIRANTENVGKDPDEKIVRFVDDFLDFLLSPCGIPWSAIPCGITGNIHPYVDGKEHRFRIDKNGEIILEHR